MQTYRSLPLRDARLHTIEKYILLISLVTASSAIFLASTTHGIGILPDSVAYMRIGSAQHFAPLYTWLLQTGTLLGITITEAAWWLGWGLLIINVLIILHILQLAMLSFGWAAICTALTTSHPVFVELHATAMTEPLYLTLVLSAVLTFSDAVERRQRVRFLLAGAIVGLAMLTRFAAAPVLPALIVARILIGGKSPYEKLVDCALMVLATAVVFGSWLLASELTTGESTGRAFELLGELDLSFWIRTLEAMSVMLLPAPLSPLVRLTFLMLVSGGVVWIIAGYIGWWLRQPGTERAASPLTVPSILGLISILYALFLIVSVMIQYRLNLTGRFLLPLYVFLVLASASAIGARNSGFKSQRRLVAVLATLAGLVLASNLIRTTVWTVTAHRSGIGYATPELAASPILSAVSELPSDAPIFTNAPDLIAFHLQRQAEYLPRHFNHLTGREDPDRPFSEQLAQLRRSLEDGDAYVVFVDRINWRDYLLSEQELHRQAPLAEVAALPDGRIYAWSNS